MEHKKAPEKDFRKRSYQYFLIGLVFALSSTLVAFEWTTFTTIPVIPDFAYEEEIPTEEIPITRIKKPELPEPTPPKPKVPVLDPVKKIVVSIEPTPTPIDTGFVEPSFDPEPLAVETIPEPTRFPEVFPEFVGGEEALYKYLSENLKYPKFPRDNGIEAKLFVQFIVNEDGSISDVKVLRPQGYGFDEAAAKVIKGMPKWKPGKKAGRNVRVIYVIPINFALN